MQLTSGMRQAIAVGVGATLGVATAGGAFVALTANDDSSRLIGGIVAGTSLVAGAGLGALLLRNPGLRPEVGIGALAFVGLPSLLATGFIQNQRDFG